MSKVSITTRDGNEHVMSVETYTRWLCLVEAIDVIQKAAERNNINLDKRTDWVKPLAIQKYMDERFHSMMHDVKVEEHLYVSVKDLEQELEISTPTVELLEVVHQSSQEQIPQTQLHE